MTRARTRHPRHQRTYGVLAGRVVDGMLSLRRGSGHYEIWLRAGEEDFRIAINVRSEDGSHVVALYDPAFAKPVKVDLTALAAGPGGFTPLTTGPQGQGLDYLRDGLFNVADMQPVPADGESFNLHDLLDAEVQEARADSETVVIAFGEYFRDRGEDEYFRFRPEQGVHDIHMMQGNSGQFADDNRINGDGALFIRKKGAMAALFIRFASQAIRTNEYGAALADEVAITQSHQPKS